MPNPRANRPLTLDRVVDDLKSFSVPAQGLFDMMAGALRGSAVATAGLPGDIETLGRMGLNAIGGSFNPAMPSRSGRAFQPVSEEPFFPSSEELAKRFPPTIPNGDPMRRKSAEPFEELGQFAPLPLSGKALKVLPYALGRGTGEVTKEAARMVNDAMLYGQGPLAKVTPQVQRMFIGPQAKVWNHSMAQVAESMEKAGADPVEIWQKTGTFRGADGKLRQEISDKPAQFFNADQIKQRAGEESEAIKELQGRLVTDLNQKDLFPKLLTEAKKPVRAEVKQRKEALTELHGPRTLPYRGNFAPVAFEHPELYEAYPELKKYLVSQGGRGGSARGSLMGENIDIYEAGLRGDPRSTMLHEMQHAVQGIEDFAPGGNPAMAFAQPEAMKILEEMRLKALKPMSFEEYAENYSHLANKEKGYEEYLKSIPGIVKKMDRELQTEAAMEYYKRLAGEAEARATQERMNMTPTERQENFPLSSYDVLEENLIVKPPKRDPFSEEDGMAAGGLLKGVKAIRKGALSAERSMPARGALRFADEPAGGPSVIKEKGGNWMSGSAEKAVGPLLQKGMINNREIPYGPEFDAAIRQRIEDLKQHASKPDYKGGAGRVVEHLERELENPRANEAAINKWVQSNLTNYIKKEMATPEDPVRRLAEEGVTHLPAGTPMPRNMSSVWASREEAGFPSAMGTSREAQVWEAMSDKPVGFGTAGEMINTGRGEPWMEKVDPFTRVHGIAPMESSNMARDLGFNHIVDVLRADLAAGRIRPEQLNKVSMEQAVRRTYEYDQELAKKMAEARTSAREGLPVHKEYPEGYRWIELNRPGAFAQESEAMGHSVRGYEPPRGHSDWIAGSGDEGSPGYGHGGWEAIKSGKAKVYSLVDPKGEPHVTVEVQSLRGSELGRYAADLPEGEDVAAMKNPPLRITQIKGKGNAAPKEEYLPFVQDFVKSGEWSDVGDLHNTELRDVKFMTNPDVYEKYLERGLTVPKYATEKELDELHNEYLRFAEPQNYKPPEDGMKRGGSVHISDNPDTMMMELGDQQFQVGGIVDAAARAAKAAKAAQLKKAMKASEALAQIEGKNLNITQADRTKVGEGLLGGPGFSGLQHQEGPHKEVGAVWGVKNPGTAKTMLGGLKNPLGNEYFTTMIGSPTQHQSNQMVFDKLYGKFKSEAKKGNLDPELQQKINERLANAVDKDGNPVFPPDVDILSKDFKKIANTFDRRSIAGNLIGGVGVGGRKGQIIDYDKIIRDTTDPFLLDMPSGALGHRLWTPSGEIIERPDLHPAFPAIATGEDLGVEFTPAAQDILMAPWIENVRQTKGRNPGYMDWTRGRPPSVRVSEDILRNLEESGNKEGGAITVKPKKDGQKFKPSKKPDQILKHGQAMPRGKDPEIDIGQMMPMMAGGGKLSKVALEAIQRMKAMRPEIAAKSSLEQKALAENTAKYARDIQPFSMTDEEVAAEMKRLESKGMAGGGEVNADDLILEERPL